MRAADITEGDTLKLKRDNPYGLGPVLVRVTAIRENPPYKVPWIVSTDYDNGSGGPACFRPSDFSGRA